MSEEVITQDTSSGRVHKRYRMPGGQLASWEGCNLDDAGDYRIIPQLGKVSEYADRCRNCFPEDDGSTQPVETVP